MLDVLKSPNPKVRKDHSHLSKNLLDRMKPEQSRPNEKKATHQHQLQPIKRLSGVLF